MLLSWGLRVQFREARVGGSEAGSRCEGIAGGGEQRGGEGTKGLEREPGEGRWVKQRAGSCGRWQTERSKGGR